MQTSRISKKLFAPLAAALVFLAAGTLSAQAPSGVPVFQFDKAKSSIGFNVKASVAIAGKFDQWDATLTFTSPDVTTGVLDIKVRRPASIPEAA